MRRGACALLLPLALGSAGCTVVRVSGTDHVQLAAGVLRLAPAPGVASVAYRATGIGLVPGYGGTTLGFRREVAAFVYAPERCQLLLLRPRPGDVAAIGAALSAAGFTGDQLCVGGE